MSKRKIEDFIIKFIGGLTFATGLAFLIQNSSMTLLSVNSIISTVVMAFGLTVLVFNFNKKSVVAKVKT